MTETLTLQFDGGSRGNPGPAGIGVVIRAQDGTPLFTLGRYIGNATNNVAEYSALIVALQEAKKLGATKIVIRGDSELVIKQMRGEYRVKHPDMKVLCGQAQTLVKGFEKVEIGHNLREKNVLADKLANLAMDRKQDVTDSDSQTGGGGDGGTVPDAALPIDSASPVSPEVGDEFFCSRCGCAIELKRPSSIRPHQLKKFVCQCGAKMSARHEAGRGLQT